MVPPTIVPMDLAFTYVRDFKKTTHPNTTAQQTSLILQDVTAEKNAFHHTS